MPNIAEQNRVVVVIDHHGAHVYKHLKESGSGDETTVKPYDPHHFHHHQVHRKESHYRGERVPEEESFYEDVIAQIVSASEIVLIGHGTGKSSAVDHLAEYLGKHRKDIASKVVATEHADLSALTAPQLEALARERMSK